MTSSNKIEWIRKNNGEIHLSGHPIFIRMSNRNDFSFELVRTGRDGKQFKELYATLAFAKSEGERKANEIEELFGEV